ncbi:MAG: LuxR C-terminal-related transcriptional regulator [Chloroflexota bacterium]|nr:LuxR C-terminal-related transcriptional regulator [Chloroflexota bacterium]
MNRRGRPRYPDVLTPREWEVLHLMRERLTNEEIASRLDISFATAKFHVSEIISKLGVSDRHEAAAWRGEGVEAGTRRGFAGLAAALWGKRLPFAWLPKAAAGAVLTAAAAGIALLAWGVWSTSSDAVTKTGCDAEQGAGNSPNCAPGVAPAAAGTGAASAGTISAISAGGSGTCAVKDGGVWCWGAAGNGYFGRGKGTTTDSSVPVALPGLTSGVSAITGASGSGCAIKGGGVWCWNTYSIDNPDPSLACLTRYPGCFASSLLAVPELASGVTAISVGCAVKDGGARCVGSNEDPGNSEATAAACQAGACDIPVFAPVPGLASGVSAISGGGQGLTCAVKDGGAWCWGSNWGGQLGNDSTTDSLVPVAVAGLGSGVSAIGVGDAHACAVKDAGLWCWGASDKGQLGSSGAKNVCGLVAFFPCSHVPVPVPGLESGVSAISVGPANTCALSGGGVWCWGLNANGQLGDNTTTDSPVPVAVPGLASGVSAISTGGDHTCAVTDAGVRCWGNNAVGQLGNNRPKGSDVPVAVSGLTSGVSAISGSWGDHSCALKGGAVSCWGANNNGQLGNNSTADGAVPVAVSGLASGVSAISAGACALKDDGLWCWGNLASGLATGNGSVGESHVPVAVAGLADGVSAIIAGSAAMSCALKDGAVWCAGLGFPGNTVSVKVPGFESGVSAISESCGLKDGGAWCWGWGEGDGSGNGTLRSARPVPGLTSGVSAIADGCALKDGGVWCWGSVGYGQQADRPLSPAEPVAGLGSGVVAISGSCAVKEGGVWCWESSDPPGAVPVAIPGLESGVSAISWNCALKEGGVWCWGDNSHGQLGNNSPADSPVPVAVVFPP